VERKSKEKLLSVADIFSTANSLHHAKLINDIV